VTIREKLRNVYRRVEQAVTLVLGSLLVLLLFTAGITQTQYFRDRLREFALSSLDSVLNAELTLGTIKGNLITGFSVDTLAVVVDGLPVLTAGEVSFRYNPLRIPGNVIAVTSAVLHHPVFYLRCDSSGTWNTAGILRPGPPESTPARSGPFPWKIDLDRFELRNATIVVEDEGEPRLARTDPVRVGRIDYGHVVVDDVNLAMSFRYTADDLRAGITRVSGTLAGTPLRLRHFSGTFHVTPELVEVNDLLAITDSTKLMLEASLRGPNALEGISLDSLRTAVMALELEAERFSLTDLACLLPPVHFLKGTLAANLAAGGNFDTLNVQELELAMGDSRLRLHGDVVNLYDPANLWLDVAMDQSVIYPADPLMVLPSFDLPDFRLLGPVELSLTYRGYPLDFRTGGTITSRAGAIAIDTLALAIGGPDVLRYRGSLTTQNLNLAGVFDDHTLNSRLTGRFTIDGRGVDLRRLTATAYAELDASEFQGLDVRGSTLSVTAGGNVARGTYRGTLGSTAMNLMAEVNAQNPDERAYALEGNVAGLNLARMLGDSTLESDLTSTFSLRARGNSLRTLSGNTSVEFTNSRYRDYAVEYAGVDVNLQQSDSLNKSLELTSPFLDLSLSGAFDLPSLGTLMALTWDNIRGGIHATLSPVDTLFSMPVDTILFAQRLRELRAEGAMYDILCDIRLKDVEVLSVILRSRRFNGAGRLNATVSGDQENLDFAAQISLEEFFYGDVDYGALIQDGVATIAIHDLPPHRDITSFRGDFAITAAAVDIGTTHFDSLAVRLTHEGNNWRLQAGSVVDRELFLATTCSLMVQGDSVVCSIDTLATQYRGLRWDSDPTARLLFRGKETRLSDLVLRNATQTLRADGEILASGVLRGSLVGTGIDMDNLKFFTEEDGSLTADRIYAGTMDLAVVASGTVSNPRFVSTARAESITIRSVPFGKLEARLTLENGALTMDVAGGRGDSDTSGSVLRMQGTLPLTDKDRQMDLMLISEGTDVGFLDPFLPVIDDLKGQLQCQLHVRGTPRRPLYEGTITLTEWEFLFEPNNIVYRFSGTFDAARDRIRVQTATLRNILEDNRTNREGVVTLSGDFALRNLLPGDFNLRANGELLVVKESTRQSALEVSGELFVETGPEGLAFTGEIDRSLLRGDVIIRNSRLVFPPTRAVVAQESPLSVPVVVYDDTSKYGARSLVSAAERYFSTPGRANGSPGADIPGRSVSFMDGLEYDLNIEALGGSTQIQIIFNPISSEELVANVDGRFRITADGKQWFGEVNVTRSYYQFYRRFEAEGRMRYAGDFMNPEMDILARYRGSRTVTDSVSTRQEPVDVTLHITGSRNQPKLAIDMKVAETDYQTYRGPKSNDEESDALGFIVYGTFPLSTSQRDEAAAEVQKVLGASLLTGASSQLTGPLSEFLRDKTGFISSVELSFVTAGGGTGTSADIRLSGTAFSGYWRYGGQILDDPLGNANFSIVYSLGTITQKPSLQNFLLEFERRVESGSFESSSDLKRVNSARLYYRFSF
jgi:hypothetical protein